MTRLYGWAPRGRRLVDKVPHGHWKTATFLAALRNDRIDAPCVFDGPINGERFLAYVEQFLVPTLRSLRQTRCGSKSERRRILHVRAADLQSRGYLIGESLDKKSSSNSPS